MSWRKCWVAGKKIVHEYCHLVFSFFSGEQFSRIACTWRVSESIELIAVTENYLRLQVYTSVIRAISEYNFRTALILKDISVDLTSVLLILLRI